MKIMILTLLVLFPSALPARMAVPSSDSDEQALTAFKASLLLDPFNSLFHTFCNWTGITCSSRRQRVVSMNLTGMGLTGPISPFLGNLSFIKVIDLSNNSFHGHIPYQTGKLFRLKMLDLSHNILEGAIPSSLGGCRSLQVLSLSFNNLSGSIPSELSLLSNLETLSLVVNNLTGVIPAFLGNLSFLSSIRLSENKLQGNIPAELGMLSKLYWLNLHTNNLTGLIPVTLSNCTGLQILQLYRNHLSGPVPWEFGRLSELQQVYMWGNQLSGEIPSSVGNWTKLQVLYLERNNLSGTVPLQFGKMQQLRRFVLWQNHFVSGSSGLSIITALSNCSSLEDLELGLNYLTGVLPTSIGRLSNSLNILSLSFNEIEGNIPEEIGNLTNLAFVTLEVNRFSGTIPFSLSKLPNLERLFLDANNLQGRIPEGFGLARRLGWLSISQTMLSGEIPDTLGDLPQLRRLELHHNQLSGKIPASLGRCQTLEMVDLSHNKLTGKIPPEVAGLQNLQFYFNVSNNLLQGSILEMSKMVAVSAIDLSHNNLSGGIPSALASCKGLEYLNLSWNAFESTIPATLANLQNLQYMDLSCNNLSGTIPKVLQKMKMLHHLNLSSNQLTGEVPEAGAFANLDASEIKGNLGLCGTWINLPPCPHSNHKHQLVSKKIMIPIIVGVSILIISLLLVAISYMWRRSGTPVLHIWPPKISYQELVDATGGFSDNNLLGIGSFGSVYKGTLNNGTNIAVKVFKLQDDHAHQSFSRECNSLKRVRHRNVIRIISACSNLDFKALILPFMSNGSLERWLYPPQGGDCRLKLSDRLRIAVEIAQGMAYLHHYCFVQLIHCDLKPSNVLLGDDMTSYIADFGISNLILNNSMDALTSTNDTLKGSVGYIAPEYGIGGKPTTKGDVYSYGILVLQLLTRKRPTNDMFIEGLNLQKWAEMNFPDRISDLVDSSLLIDVHESERSKLMECLIQSVQIGLICTRELPQERPSMIEIVERLNTLRSRLLGTPKGIQLPVDISTFLDNTKGINMEGWSTSTS